MAVEKASRSELSFDGDVEDAVERDEKKSMLRRRALGSSPGPGSPLGTCPIGSRTCAAAGQDEDLDDVAKVAAGKAFDVVQKGF